MKNKREMDPCRLSNHSPGQAVSLHSQGEDGRVVVVVVKLRCGQYENK